MCTNRNVNGATRKERLISDIARKVVEEAICFQASHFSLSQFCDAGANLLVVDDLASLPLQDRQQLPIRLPSEGERLGWQTRAPVEV